MTKFHIGIAIALWLTVACRTRTALKTTQPRNFETSTATTQPQPKDVYLLEIKTDVGVMKVRLYNETPLHRDNMVKLADNGFFEGLLFHRVIRNFVIQGGDPDSKVAEPGKLLGDGGNGYTIPAEFHSQTLFHKKGALAAARDGDDVNPKKESSGCQFYIVQGKVHDDASLEKNERRINRDVIKKISDSILSLPENSELRQAFERVKVKPQRSDSLSLLQAKIDSLVNPVYVQARHYRIPEFQRNIYKKIGGTPHLDSHYTVFGEVYEGLDVLDAIILSETDTNDRPKKDVKMFVRVIQRPNR
jgi:peptidylprolyl isomerase